MEILGMKIPGLEDAVFSGLESVTSGIKESAKASGIFTLGIAAESFSFSEPTTAPAANLPSVEDAATILAHQTTSGASRAMPRHYSHCRIFQIS